MVKTLTITIVIIYKDNVIDPRLVPQGPEGVPWRVA